jgi:hypothetical protein
MFLKPNLDITKIFEVAEDVLQTLPDIEASIPILRSVLTALESGQMPNLTAAQLAQLAKDEQAIEKLVADIKALAA